MTFTKMSLVALAMGALVVGSAAAQQPGTGQPAGPTGDLPRVPVVTEPTRQGIEPPPMPIPDRPPAPVLNGQAETFRPAVPGVSPGPTYRDYNGLLIDELDRPRDMSLPGLARQYMLDGMTLDWLTNEVELARRHANSVLFQLYAQAREHPELDDARRRLLAAQNQFQQARVQVLRELRDNTTYRDYQAERDRIEQRIAQLRQMGRDQQEILTLAEARMRLAATPARIEREALQGSQAYEDAREQVVRANLEHERLRQKLEAAVPNHPLYLSALNRVNEIEDRLALQWMQFAGTTAAYGQALENQALRADYARRFGFGYAGPRYGRVGVGWGFTGVQVGAPLPPNWW